MKKYVRWIFTLVAVLSAIPAVAGKVGFLDADRAIMTVQEGKRQYQALDAWADQRSNQVEALKKQVVQLADQLENQQNVASEEVATRLREELLQAQRALEDGARQVQYDFEAKKKELLAQVATRVRNLASEYAKANGFDAIFMFEALPLVYVNESTVITDEVIQLYNQRYPVD